MNTLSETEKAYIAGLFDGEGCISISKYQGKNNRTPVYQLHVVIGQKVDILSELCKMCGVGTICNMDKGKYGMFQQWTIPPRESIEFLKEILPYLKLKGNEAEIAIEFQEKQGRQVSTGKGWTVPQNLIDEKEKYYQLLRDYKGISGGNGGRGRNRNPKK